MLETDPERGASLPELSLFSTSVTGIVPKLAALLDWYAESYSTAQCTALHPI
jgi:hypothetical protein